VEKTTALPDDLLKAQSTRILVINAVGAALWALNLVMDLYMSPHGDRGPYRLLIEALGMAFAAGVACYARFGRSSDRVKVGIVGVWFIVPHAFALALLNSWTPQPTTMRPISGIAVLILFVGMMAPARPRAVLLASLAAASMDPLGVWIAHLRGLPVPSVLNAFLMFYPNYLCAVLTALPARVLYRLGKQIGEERALGSYHLVERLGAGGMGEVWLARHRMLARCAAIKFIRPEMLSDAGSEDAALTLRRFEREAHATAALTSPHTIRLFDFGVTGEGAFYYVMELLDGRDLESLVREFGPLPPARVMHLVRQICRSLAEAHEMGLVHRDIKPANIYVCRLGNEYDFVKVLDFGLVKHDDQSVASTLTRGPATVGTPAYMAPEIILGDDGGDRRVDVYAVGCVAYFLLTGRPVFSGDTPMKLLMRHVHDEPMAPSLRTEQPIPGNVDDFVMACLHKDPNQRPQNAEELFELASRCQTSDAWDLYRARKWWQVHLPDLTRPKEMVMSRSRRTAVACAAALLTLVLSGPNVWAQTQTSSRTALANADTSASLESTTRLAGPAVVEIFTTSFTPGAGLVPSSADLVTTQRASGSGVIVDANGYIVTNAHVVRGAQRVRVALPLPAVGRSILGTGSRTVPGEVVGIDLETDLAVIKVEEQNLPSLIFGDSDELEAGQIVLAFGSPLGLRNSVSLGVVSAAARQLEADSPMIYVQTDASINPGSSGGALVDLRGRLMGINTLILSQAGGNEGLGFAAPSNIVRTVYEQIKTTGRVRRGDIGIRPQSVTPVMASALGLTRGYGAILADVLPGGAGARAGLRPGDLVLTLDGKPIENGRQLQIGLYRHLAGDVVSMEILRDGQTMKVPVAMTERHDPVADLSASIDPRRNLVPRLSILGVTLTARLAELLPVVRVRGGVVVASTVAGALDARDGGLAPGDVIYAVNRTAVPGLAELHALLEALKPGDPVVLHLERRGELMLLAFTVE
jgi:serine/threonine-protein kinase